MSPTLAEDFEDDGASFRARRQAYVHSRFVTAIPNRPLPMSVRLGLTGLGLGIVGFGILFLTFVAISIYVLTAG